MLKAVYVSDELHRQLRIKCATLGISVHDAAETAIQASFDRGDDLSGKKEDLHIESDSLPNGKERMEDEQKLQ